MERNWSDRLPHTPGWYFIKCATISAQLAWICHSGGVWHAVVRHNAPLALTDLDQPKFDGPLNEPSRLISQDYAS